jgi:hypothetical protein
LEASINEDLGLYVLGAYNVDISCRFFKYLQTFTPIRCYISKLIDLIMGKINIEETLKSLKENVVKGFIESKLETESFTDQQVGLIKGWLSDAVDVGFSLGEKSGIASADPEAMEKFSDILNKAVGGGKDVEKLKNYIMLQRCISRYQNSLIGFYDSMIDTLCKDANLTPNRGFCYELAGV